MRVVESNLPNVGLYSSLTQMNSLNTGHRLVTVEAWLVPRGAVGVVYAAVFCDQCVSIRSNTC